MRQSTRWDTRATAARTTLMQEPFKMVLTQHVSSLFCADRDLSDISIFIITFRSPAASIWFPIPQTAFQRSTTVVDLPSAPQSPQMRPANFQRCLYHVPHS